MSREPRPTYYSAPSLTEGMQWVASLCDERGGRAEVLMSAETDRNKKPYVCVSVRHYYAPRNGSYELMMFEELRVYESVHTSIGAILMKLAHRLEQRLHDREATAAKQAHF